MRTGLISFFILIAGVTVKGQQDCIEIAYPLPKLSDSIKRAFEKNYTEARQRFINDSLNAENIIWFGRRAAYLGNYKEAIRVFSYGDSLYPNDARFKRHRGHRYITLRCIDLAIADLSKAAALIKDREDEIEADGLPNARNIPTSTLHSNIWYHLGLAHYLKGDYQNALVAYENALKVSDNNDMYVATMNWLYVTLRKLGRNTEAKERLKNISSDMELIENKDYLEILLMYKNDDESSLLAKTNTQETLSNATLGYGLGNYYLEKGNRKKAKEIFQKVYSGPQWSSFGYIAAEKELEKL